MCFKVGSALMEEQLRLMEDRFVKLKSALDFTRIQNSDEMKVVGREFVRLHASIEDLRRKWNEAEDQLRRVKYNLPPPKDGKSVSKKGFGAPAGTGEQDGSVHSEELSSGDDSDNDDHDYDSAETGGERL